MKRCLILSPFGHKSDRNISVMGGIRSEALIEALPASILYWDKIFAPDAFNGVDQEKDISIDHLEKLGVAEPAFSYGDLGKVKTGQLARATMEMAHSSFAKALTDFDSREKEVWSILPLEPQRNATVAEQVSPLLGCSEKVNTSIEVCLRNALPVPERNVSFEELLEFKLKRRDQIERLHTELSQVAARYVNSEHSEKAIALAVADVMNAISELQTVFNESWTSRFTKDLKSAFFFEGALPASVSGLAGLPIDQAFLVGAGCSVLSATIKASLDKKKHSENPYSYVLETQSI